MTTKDLLKIGIVVLAALVVYGMVIKPRVEKTDSLDEFEDLETE